MDLAARLVGLSDQVAPALLVFTRVVGVFASSPVVGGEFVPPQVKALLAMAVTLAIAPGLHLEPGIVNAWPFVLALGRELLVGLTVGIVFTFFLEAVRFGGDLIGRQAGFAAAEYFDPTSDVFSGPVGTLFYAAVVLLFLGTDGHHQFFLALQRSYDLIPVGAAAVGPGLADATAHAADQVFSIAMAVAFPVVVAIMALTVADAVIARAVPQINLLVITFINKILISLLMLYVGMPAAVAFLGAVLVAARDAAFSALRLLG